MGNNVVILGKGKTIISLGQATFSSENKTKPTISLSLPIDGLERKLGTKTIDVERENVVTMIFDNIEGIEIVEKYLNKCKEILKQE